MCLAVPSRVIEIEGDFATVEALGQRRRVSLMLMREPVSLGDYLIVRAGEFAIERLEPDRAEESLRLFADLVAAGENAHAR